MTTTAFPNGQVLTSSAITQSAIDILLQALTCQVLGSNPPDLSLVRLDWPEEGQPAWDINADVGFLKCILRDDPYARVRDRELTQTGPVAITAASLNYSSALTSDGHGLPIGQVILLTLKGFTGNWVSLNGQMPVTVIDANTFSVAINSIAFGALTGTPTWTVLSDNWSYTRPWDIAWTFYGPNCLDRARIVHSATFMDYFNDQLNLSNLFTVSNPPVPTRFKENFNAQWWDRSDFHIELYEQVNETINPGLTTSVEVKVYDKGGLEADVTIHS